MLTVLRRSCICFLIQFTVGKQLITFPKMDVDDSSLLISTRSQDYNSSFSNQNANSFISEVKNAVITECGYTNVVLFSNFASLVIYPFKLVFGVILSDVSLLSPYYYLLSEHKLSVIFMSSCICKDVVQDSTKNIFIVHGK